MIQYNLENYEETIEELKPLLAEHNIEVGSYTESLELDPKWGIYEELDALGYLTIFTMRDEGELIGYNIFRVDTHIHYQQDLWADNDVLYIKPEYRHAETTIEFLEFCEDALRDSYYVKVITYQMPVSQPFSTLMSNLKMDNAEQFYTKYIG
jgi:hypothetical protein